MPTDLELRYLKSKPLAFTSDVEPDTHDNIIRGVVMAQAGEAKGHDMFLDQDFIDALVAYDRKNFSKNGLKARLDHPALCNGTMGTQLGKLFNFRVVGDKAVADLQLLNAADLSPTRPNQAAWVMEMAKESPDFLMSSIVFKPGAYYQRTTEGEKQYVAKMNERGKMQKLAEADDTLGNLFVELGEHYYTDIVEAGAATDNLFSEQFNSDKLGVQAVQFFEDNPELHTYLKAHPRKVLEFLGKVGIKVEPKRQFVKTFFTLFGAKNEENDLDTCPECGAEIPADNDLDECPSCQAAIKKDVEASALLADTVSKLSTSEKSRLELTNQLEAANADLLIAQTALSAANDRIAELEKENTELKEEPAALHSDGFKDGAKGEVEYTPANTEVNRIVAERRKARGKNFVKI